MICDRTFVASISNSFRPVKACLTGTRNSVLYSTIKRYVFVSEIVYRTGCVTTTSWPCASSLSFPGLKAGHESKLCLYHESQIKTGHVPTHCLYHDSMLTMSEIVVCTTTAAVSEQ